MTDLNLDKLEWLCKWATPAPWDEGKPTEDGLTSIGPIRARNCSVLITSSNLNFIQTARTALPALIAEVRRLQHEAERAEAERDFAITKHITRKVCPPGRLCGMAWGVRKLDQCSACWREAAHFSDEEDEEV